MIGPTLACGPWIDFQAPSFWVPAAVFMILKPLAYFAFIQAFRYRVSRPIPMTFRQAARLALLRAGLGILFFGAGAAVIAVTQSDALLVYSWVYLYLERVAAWFIVGRRGAGLRGRRLVGWVIGGVMVNATFDFAAILGLFGAWWLIGAVAAGLGLCIALLDRIGRRAALRARFTTPFCERCRYELTGNLSGLCPECGTPVALAA